MEEGKTEDVLNINHRIERIEIDKETEIIVEIFKEIVEREPLSGWFRQILQKVSKGDKDIFIIMESPVSRTKYYIVKDHLINKIYDCCVYKGLVSYEDILNEEIG